MESSSCPTTQLAFCLFFLCILSAQASIQVPFGLKTVVPLLPKQASWPFLNQLNGPADILPKFVGSAKNTNRSLEWKGACFYESKAWLELHNKAGSQFGGGTLHLQLSKPHSWTCMDIYMFATPYRIVVDYYFRAGTHTIDYEWESKADYEYVKERGVSIFLVQGGLVDTVKALIELMPLFSNDEAGEEANIEFLNKQMGATFELRPKASWVSNINPDDIHSGDFLAFSKIRGRWGAFETLEKWVTGAYAGHTAVCLRDPQGKLWVAESGRDSDTGEGEIIDMLPWEEWWEFELKKDPSNPHIALLPLHPNVRAKFDEAAAWKYALSMKGKPYGYQNLIFSWIDTVADNYPPPLDDNLVAAGMTVWTQVAPEFAGKLINEALNKRLGTKGLSLPEILVEVEKRGSSFGELLAIPEQDDWVYSVGKSASCVAFVMGVYKAAGLFDPIASSVQGTEFTVKDAYVLKFYEDNLSRLPKWCNAGDHVKLPFCQILGNYRMELPGYNSLDPYSHMNERCPSLPPSYPRPAKC